MSELHDVVWIDRVTVETIRGEAGKDTGTLQMEHDNDFIDEEDYPTQDDENVEAARARGWEGVWWPTRGRKNSLQGAFEWIQTGQRYMGASWAYHQIFHQAVHRQSKTDNQSREKEDIALKYSWSQTESNPTTGRLLLAEVCMIMYPAAKIHHNFLKRYYNNNPQIGMTTMESRSPRRIQVGAILSQDNAATRTMQAGMRWTFKRYDDNCKWEPETDASRCDTVRRCCQRTMLPSERWTSERYDCNGCEEHELPSKDDVVTRTMPSKEQLHHKGPKPLKIHKSKNSNPHGTSNTPWLDTNWWHFTGGKQQRVLVRTQNSRRT